MPKQKVLFKFGTAAQYAALETKLDNALYFLLDTHQLFRGETPIAQSHVYTGGRQLGETDSEAIATVLNTNSPVPGDIAVITDSDGSSKAFIYGISGDWITLANSVDVSSQITNLNNRVSSLEDLINGVPANIEQGTEAVIGLNARVIALETSVGSLAGVFHFKGTKNSIEELNEIINPNEGDVYQVGLSEYVYNGSSWVELGPNIDLSNYATTTYVDNKIGQPSHTILNQETGEEENLPASGIYADLINKADELIPIFNGITAGLVPVAQNNLSTSEKANLFLNANGAWATIASSGGQSTYTAPDGTTFNTAEAYVEYMTSNYSEFYWDSLDE